ncbi:MAG: PEGA domain-containing protein, partial [Acidobacteria bacterium]|nr:PEGA domain-containing protein [Acidobacteriota bacterium]
MSDRYARSALSFRTMVGVMIAGVAVLWLTTANAARAGVPQDQPPLTDDAIVQLLQSGVPPLRVEQLARERGITFAVSPDIERRLRAVGATDDLIKTLRDLAPRPKVEAPPLRPGLSVTTDPSGATVLVDGNVRGQSPLKLTDLSPGDYRVTLRKVGYLENSRVVTIREGQAETLDVKLTPMPAGAPVPQTPTTPSGPTTASQPKGSNMKWIILGAAGA